VLTISRSAADRSANVVGRKDRSVE
jgi:hypothetical protein